MHKECYEIEAMVYYLTTDEGGRKSGVSSDYRGQFYYEGNDHDGFQYFPDNDWVELGETVRTQIRFSIKRWEAVHSKAITVGMQFEIREGARTVGRGKVTKIGGKQVTRTFDRK